MWTVLYHAPVKASYRYRGDVQIVADCVIMSPLGVATRVSQQTGRFATREWDQVQNWLEGGMGLK